MRTRAALALLLVAVALGAAACRPSPEEVAVEREELRATLEDYTTRLAQAYAFTDATLLAPVASQREVASVARNIDVLARAGQRLATDLKELEIEDVDSSGPGNAYVSTFEVWEIRVMDLGSDRLVSIDRDQRNRVRYQLEKEEGRWRVLWRQRTEEGAAPGGAAGGGGGGS
jgi:hypothetical protein